MSVLEDKEIGLVDAEMAVVEQETISDSELIDIEDHLKRLYLNNIKELYNKLNVRVELEALAKRPLYVAAINFCNGDYENVAKILGITVSNFKYKLAGYYGTTNTDKFVLTDLDERLNLLYRNYLEQILVDGLSVKFTQIVERAMIRAAMEYSKDNLTMGSRVLGMRKTALVEKLNEYFGCSEIYKLEKGVESA